MGFFYFWRVQEYKSRKEKNLPVFCPKVRKMVQKLTQPINIFFLTLFRIMKNIKSLTLVALYSTQFTDLFDILHDKYRTYDLI